MITVTLPKPMTSERKGEKGRFGKQDFRYVAAEDIYVCPAGEEARLPLHDRGKRIALRRYWTNVCQSCAIKPTCTTGKERRITRWEHEHMLGAVQRRLDEHPEKMRQRRETAEHPFGTIKARMGATHFLMIRMPRVAPDIYALHVLAYNLDPGHEHQGHSAAHRRDAGLAKPEKGSPQRHPNKTATLRHFRQSVSTQPRPIAAMSPRGARLRRSGA